MSILNYLFEQIIQSEERIRKRFTKLREVNNEIQVYQAKYQDFTDELKSLQGLLVLKSQRLAEEELNLKWFKISETVLTQKKKELLEREKILIQQKEEIEDATDCDKEEFSREVVKFMALFDFCGKGKEKRMTEANEVMGELKSEEQRIKQEMTRLEQTQEQKKNLLKEKNDLLVTKSQLQSKLTVLTTQLLNAVNQTQLLQDEKQRAALKPQNDAEFRRLTNELEAMKDNTMEGICEALTDELNELQQQIHLKNQLLKQKQQQQQQGKRRTIQHNQIPSWTTVQDKGRTWRKQLNKKMCQDSDME